MATHSSVLAGRIPGTGEPGGLPSVGSHRVGHDWSDLAAAAARPITSFNEYLLNWVTEIYEIYGESRNKSSSRLTCMHVLEKEMAAHTGILAWRIPGTGEPGGLPPLGSHRVGLKWLSSSSSSSSVWGDLREFNWDRALGRSLGMGGVWGGVE